MMLSFSSVGSVATAVSASTPDTWTPDRQLPWIEVLGIYVGLPVALFVVIAVLAMAPSMIRGTSSYRPGLSWWAAPQWFGTEPKDNGDGEDASAELGERGGVGARW